MAKRALQICFNAPWVYVTLWHTGDLFRLLCLQCLQFEPRHKRRCHNCACDNDIDSHVLNVCAEPDQEVSVDIGMWYKIITWIAAPLCTPYHMLHQHIYEFTPASRDIRAILTVAVWCGGMALQAPVRHVLFSKSEEVSAASIVSKFPILATSSALVGLFLNAKATYVEEQSPIRCESSLPPPRP